MPWCAYVVNEVAAVSSQGKNLLGVEAPHIHIECLEDGVEKSGREKSQPSVVQPRHQFLSLRRSDGIHQKSSDDPGSKEECSKRC